MRVTQQAIIAQGAREEEKGEEEARALSQKSLMSSTFTSSHQKEGDLGPNLPDNRRQPRLGSL